MPLAELDFTVKQFKPDYMVTYITGPAAGTTLPSYIQRIAAAINPGQFIIGGSQLNAHSVKLPKNCVTVHSADELIAAIS